MYSISFINNTKDVNLLQFFIIIINWSDNFV